MQAQAGLQFFNMPIKGMGSNRIQKIAVKIDGKTFEPSNIDDNFMAIMDTLMALSPEQLQTSLAQLEWVSIEGGGESAPLIDLSGTEDGADRIFELFANNNENPKRYFTGTASTPQETPNSVDHKIPPLAATSKATEPQMPLASLKTEKTFFGLNDAHSFKAKANVDEGTIKQLDATVSLNKANVSNTGQQDGFQNIKLETDGRTPLVESGVRMPLVETEGRKPLVETEGRMPSQAKNNTTQSVPENIIKATPELASEEPSKQMPTLKMDKATASTKNADLSLNANSRNGRPEAEGRAVPEAPNGKTSVAEKPAAQIKIEQFKTMTNTLANTDNTKSVSLGNQLNETTPTLKETVRQNVQTASPAVDMDKTEVESNKVQSSSSAKDASLSFSSRWGSMLEKSAEIVSDAKSAEASPDRTETNDVIRQIVQRMTLKSGRLQSQMNIKLKPEFLGNIRMQITSDNQQIAIRMVADSSAVKEMVEQNIQYLKAELQQHGLEIDKLDVFVGGDSDELHQDQQAQWRRSRQKGQSLRQNDNGMNDSEDNDAEREKSDHRTSNSDSEIDYFA